MKREILFRGKTYDGHWIYGNLLVKGSFCYIIGTDDSKAVEVIPESVGQYTGLKDCKGNKIFEGDIVRNKWGDTCEVFWNPEFIKYQLILPDEDLIDMYAEELEIIGNTTDNKDLLTKQTEQ